MENISVNKDLAKLPFEEFEKLMKHFHPKADAKELYIKAGGKLSEKEKKGEK